MREERAVDRLDEVVRPGALISSITMYDAQIEWATAFKTAVAPPSELPYAFAVARCNGIVRTAQGRIGAEPEVCAPKAQPRFPDHRIKGENDQFSNST